MDRIPEAPQVREDINPVQPAPPLAHSARLSMKPNWDRFVGIISFLSAVLLYVLQANGVEMNWQVSLALYIAVALGGVWSCLRHAVPNLGTRGRYAWALAILLLVAFFGWIGTVKQYHRDHPAQQISSSHRGDSAEIRPLASNQTPNPSATLQAQKAKTSPSPKPQNYRHSLVTENSRGKTEHPTATPQGILSEPIVLSANIVNPHSPAITIENKSERVANGITWEAVLYRESDLALMSFATQAIGYVKPHSRGANYEMNLPSLPKFTDGDPQIRKGDVFTGSVCVDCPECKGVTYIVHFVWDVSGWTYEVQNLGARLALSKDSSLEGKRQWVMKLNDLVPNSERISIQ